MFVLGFRFCSFKVFFISGKRKTHATCLSVPRNKSRAASELKSAGRKSTAGFGKKSWRKAAG